ncbi:MAG: aspartate/glutamate racemase family protein [Anaerolineae bacterium]|nr:aspartate/glutamate racemase family protein [Anaerolineae bacterium]
MTQSMLPGVDPLRLFSDYLRVTGVAHLGPEPVRGEVDPRLLGKRLGLLNGSSWITLWANYFGRLYLPGVHLVNVGNEAVQLSFMAAHARGQPCPPRANIEAFVRYARDLVELGGVDAVLITCSTMNRAYPEVQTALAPHRIPVLPIDLPMMEQAVRHGGRVLVVATHGPTVESTQALLRETAAKMGREVAFSGLEVEAAWHRLAEGDVEGHNQALARAIQERLRREEIGCVLLAQLSMSVFHFTHPDPVAEFGVPVLSSGQCGFRRMAEILAEASSRNRQRPLGV